MTYNDCIALARILSKYLQCKVDYWENTCLAVNTSYLSGLYIKNKCISCGYSCLSIDDARTSLLHNLKVTNSDFLKAESLEEFELKLALMDPNDIKVFLSELLSFYLV